MSAPSTEPGDPGAQGTGDAGRAAAAEALRAAFARLAPQGSHAWNFQGAFNQLADRFGPDHPGTSALAEVLAAGDAATSRRGRLRRAASSGPAPSGAEADVEGAMATVVEAFRWMSARVTTLEDQLALQAHPLVAPAWLTPAAELGEWVGPLAAYVARTTPGGKVVHADCGEGGLLAALTESGVAAHGAEPRGGVALRALEAGHAVTIGEVDELLDAEPPSSLGGLVLSGVVDRLPLPALVGLLALARRSLAPGAPLVVVSIDLGVRKSEGSVIVDDLIGERSLHGATWAVLLRRAGFVFGEQLPGPGGHQTRFALAASVPG